MENNISEIDRYMRYESGISRIGIFIGFVSTIAVIIMFLIDSGFDFVSKHIFTLVSIVSISCSVGLIIWGCVVFLYRVFIWIRYGFSDSSSYTLKRVFRISNKLWLKVCFLLIILFGVQLYFINKYDYNKVNDPMANLVPMPVDTCSSLDDDAKRIKVGLSKYKQIYGKYPIDIGNIEETRFIGLLTYNKYHVKKLTSDSYEISFTNINCNEIHTIKSDNSEVIKQIVNK
jgi:cytochrome b561